MTEPEPTSSPTKRHAGELQELARWMEFVGTCTKFGCALGAGAHIATWCYRLFIARTAWDGTVESAVLIGLALLQTVGLVSFLFVGIWLIAAAKSFRELATQTEPDPETLSNAVRPLAGTYSTLGITLVVTLVIVIGLAIAGIQPV